MSWQDNRRRNRVWYQHYRRIAEELVTMSEAGIASGRDIELKDLLLMFYTLYEKYKLHRRRRCADSALASIELVCKDLGMINLSLTAKKRGSSLQRRLVATDPDPAGWPTPAPSNETLQYPPF